MKWKLKEQEREGSYYFSGTFFITRGVSVKLTDPEIATIYLLVEKLVKEKDGLDYLQVFVHENTKIKLFFIDQLSKEMIESGQYAPEYNYCTLMLASEY